MHRFSVLAALLLAVPAAAQEPSVETIGPWRLICGQDGGCVARQAILLEKGPPETGLDLFLAPGPGATASLSLVTSLDVMIEPGAGLARRGDNVAAPAWRADFSACGRGGCQASGFLDPDVLAGAEDPVAVLVSPQGQQMLVPIRLDGLEEAIARTRAAGTTADETE